MSSNVDSHANLNLDQIKNDIDITTKNYGGYTININKLFQDQTPKSNQINQPGSTLILEINEAIYAKSLNSSISNDQEIYRQNELKYGSLERSTISQNRNREKSKALWTNEANGRQVNEILRDNSFLGRDIFMFTKSNTDDVFKPKPKKEKLEKESRQTSQKNLNKEDNLENVTKILTIDLDSRLYEKNKKLEAKRKENILMNMKKQKTITPIRSRHGNKLILYRADIIPPKPLENSYKIDKKRHESAQIQKRRKFDRQKESSSIFEDITVENDSHIKEKSIREPSCYSSNKEFVIVGKIPPASVAAENQFNFNSTNITPCNQKTLQKSNLLLADTLIPINPPNKRSITPSTKFKHSNFYNSEPSRPRSQLRNANTTPTPNKEDEKKTIPSHLMATIDAYHTIDHDRTAINQKNPNRFPEVRSQLQSQSSSSKRRHYPRLLQNSNAIGMNNLDVKSTTLEKPKDTTVKKNPFERLILKDEQNTLKVETIISNPKASIVPIAHSESKRKMAFDELMSTLTLQAEIAECTKLVKANRFRTVKRVAWVDDSGVKPNKEFLRQAFKSINAYHRDHMFD